MTYLCVLHLKVDRHLRKLDIELNKFKMELEADNAGITEMLEKSEPRMSRIFKCHNVCFCHCDSLLKVS